LPEFVRVSFVAEFNSLPPPGAKPRWDWFWPRASWRGPTASLTRHGLKLEESLEKIRADFHSDFA
jgi:hypothetical protein